MFRALRHLHRASGVTRVLRVGLPLVGVAISGAELNPAAEPGTLGTTHDYPSPENVAYWLGRGVSCIRIPFRWARIQPVLNGDLDETELARLRSVVDQTTDGGAQAIISLHSLGAYTNGGALVGSATVPNTAYADLWRRLGTAFETDRGVIFALMDRPASTDWPAWIASQNAALSALRAVGATQLALVSGGHSGGLLDAVQRKDAWVALYDPAGNYAIDVARYLDTARNGTQGAVASRYAMVETLPIITAWARGAGRRLFYGEFGAGSTTDGATAVRHALGYMQRNNDVWLGATMWGAGYALGEANPLYAEPVNGVSNLAAEALLEYAPDGVRAAIPQDVFSHPGTPDAATTFAAGRIGQGRSAGVITGGPFSIASVDALTIEAWVRSPGVTALTNAVGLTNFALIGATATGNARISYGNSGNLIALSTSKPIADGQWHHVSLNVGPSGGAFYLDGTAQTSNAKSFRDALDNALPTWGSLMIGAGASGGAAWPGDVDEVAVFQGVLRTGNFVPPTEPLTGNEPNLLSLYRLEGDTTMRIGAA